MSRSPSLAGRAVMAVALMIGFYVLAVGIAALLVWIPYAEWRFTNGIHLKLAVACVFMAAVILWSVLPRPDRFVPPGPELTRAANPRLFAMIDEVATATAQPRPAEVYLVHDANAWVSSRGGIMGVGSRRIMGLGLPLLHTLNVSELKAVIAHEFGHYHGGDVALGPWIHQTRAAIGRTLQSLGGSAVIQAPFRAYGNMFLRVTHAISRAQEYAADALAARVTSVGAMKSGLRRIAGVSAAYDSYWRTEFEPVIVAGFRPPLVMGFQRFLDTGTVAKAVSDYVQKQEAESESSIYDTHPPLRERLAALESLPETGGRLDESPAISLIGEARDVEKRVLLHMLVPEHAAKLVDVPWEEVGARVLLPQWHEAIERDRAALEGTTLGALAERTRDFQAFVRTLPARPMGAPDEVLEQHARWVLSAAIGATLARLGGTPRSLPGEPVTVQMPSGEVPAFVWASELGTDALDVAEWRERCRQHGVEDERLVA